MAVQLVNFNSPIGVKLPHGVLLSPGTEIHYVHKTPSLFAAELQSANICTTIAAALNARNTSVSGAIIVLEGHTESVTAAQSWAKANTRIIFLGEGDERGTLTWTAAASSVTVSAANTRIINGRFQLEPTTGSVNVAAPFVFSAAGCAMVGCWFGAGTDASNKITIGITTTAAATRFSFVGNKVRGAALATMTTFLRVVGVTDFECIGNDIICGTTAAAVGPIQFLTTASTGILISDNKIQNIAAGSNACITGMANVAGWVEYNRLRNMTDGNNAQITASSAVWQEYENFGVNNNAETGVKLGLASA